MTSHNKTLGLRHVGFGFCLILALTLCLAWQPSEETSQTPDIKSTIDESLATRVDSQDFMFSPVESPSGTPIAVDRVAQMPDIRLSLYPELDRIIELEDLSADETPALFEPFLRSTDPVIRLAALESLGDIKRDSASLGLIVHMLDDPNPQIRIAALQAIANSKDVSLIASLETCLFDPDTSVRIAAIDALVILDHEPSAPALASLLSDPDSSVRHHTVNALGEIGGELAVNYLQQARYDSIENIQENARAILEELRAARKDISRKSE